MRVVAARLVLFDGISHHVELFCGVVTLLDESVNESLKKQLFQRIFSEYCPADITVYALFLYSKHVAPKGRVFLDCAGRNPQGINYG